MRKIFAIVTTLLAVLSAQAQEKVMNIQKTDGTVTQTRVADIDEISFLAADAGSNGMQVKTVNGDCAGVLFEANPVITAAGGRLTIKSTAAEAMEFEIADIAEILFGDVSDPADISNVKGFSFVMQDGAVLLRDIPEGITLRVYTVDGRSIATPRSSGRDILLNRQTLGTGIFIVKVGAFSTKIKL